MRTLTPRDEARLPVCLPWAIQDSNPSALAMGLGRVPPADEAPAEPCNESHEPEPSSQHQPEQREIEVPG